MRQRTGLLLAPDVGRGSTADPYASSAFLPAALTNVVKHASGASARIEVSYGEDALIITVTDEGPGRPDPAPQSAGLGITGMRERAEMFGGQLTAGNRSEGGFAVIARVRPARSGC
jgi:signal transduction histidine kinase